jgi:sec-independent protein translocase protein TatA
MRLQGWEWIIILVIVLLLWGAPKLPALAKSLGQSLKIFRGEMKKPEAEKSDKPDKADGSAKPE